MNRLLAQLLLVLAAAAPLTAQATCILREDTASQEIPLGTFVDSTDGVTAETGLTIANTDIKLQKSGATTQSNKNSGGATHIATGDYYAVLDATDTDTPGNLRIKVAVSGALPVWIDCIVVEEAIYDAYYAASATGLLPANVTQFGGTNGTFTGGRPEVNTTHAAGTAWGSGAITAASIASDAITAAKVANGAIDAATFASGAIDATAIAADAIGASELATDAIGATEIAANAIAAAEIADGALDDATFATTAGAFNSLGIVDQGTAQAATGTTLQLRSAAAFADDEIIGATCIITGGSAGVGQARTITDYVSSTDTATVATWTTTPSGTITYRCFGTAAGSGGGGSLTAADVWAHGTRTLTALDEDSTTIDLNASYVGGVTVFDEDSTTIDINATTLGTVTTLTNLPAITSNWLTAAGINADAFTAAKFASDVTTELQSGLATAAALATVDDYVDTEVAAILDDTGTSGVVIVNDGITAAKIAADAITSSELSASAVNELRDMVIEDQGNTTLACAISVILAYAAGDISTSAGTTTYEDATGAETRITGSVSTPGNRAATITCPSL